MWGPRYHQQPSWPNGHLVSSHGLNFAIHNSNSEAVPSPQCSTGCHHLHWWWAKNYVTGSCFVGCHGSWCFAGRDEFCVKRQLDEYLVTLLYLVSWMYSQVCDYTFQKAYKLVFMSLFSFFFCVPWLTFCVLLSYFLPLSVLYWCNDF